MANDLAGYNPDKALLGLALDLNAWEKAEQRPGDPVQALATLERWLVPLKDGEGLTGEAARRIVQSLRLIGAKIAPTMSEEQVQAWLSAMVAALSDLPPRIALRASQEALHVPAKFLNEIEGIIREKAEAVKARYDLARHRLERFKREMQREAQPLLVLPEMTDDELQNITPELKRIGLGAGWLHEDSEGRLSWKKD